MEERKKIDPETQVILEANQHLLDMVASPGWKIARTKIVEKILELQNVAEYTDIIQTGNATKLLKEMKANKRSAEILFAFLREIEGGAQTAIESKGSKVPSHIFVKED